MIDKQLLYYPNALMNLFVYVIAQGVSFYQLNYCFLMSFDICKEYREYQILDQVSLLRHYNQLWVFAYLLYSLK